MCTKTIPSSGKVPVLIIIYFSDPGCIEDDLIPALRWCRWALPPQGPWRLLMAGPSSGLSHQIAGHQHAEMSQPQYEQHLLHHFLVVVSIVVWQFSLLVSFIAFLGASSPASCLRLIDVSSLISEWGEISEMLPPWCWPAPPLTTRRPSMMSRPTTTPKD